MTELPSPELIAAAARTLAGTVRRTPLQLSERLSAALGRPVYLKREDTQVGRSYKVRGAYNAIHALGEKERAAGVVCASAGNHAQGVAYACNHLRIHGKIFLPATTPRQKRERIRDIGGAWVEQIIGGPTFDAAAGAALTYASAHGATFVHPFDAAPIIAGQGTVIAEAFEQCVEQSGLEPEAVLVPVGGGGLLAGTAIWVKDAHPNTRVIGVEPTGAASMQAALAAGGPVTLESVDNFADGTAVARVGDLTYAAARDLVDGFITVPEGALCTEMLELYQVDGIIAEPSGALAPAAVGRLRELGELGELGNKPDTATPPRPLIAVISGGNNDVSRYADILERSMVYEGLRHYFLVTFAQKPGALKEFLDRVLVADEDIVYFEYTKKTNRETGPALVGIDIQHPENLADLLDRMDRSGIDIHKVEPGSPEFRFFI
ncbi:threonine ammonia-lyase IlvA [Actinotignum sanguinis]|uniref:L-threonine dehydratase n=2 Tax=Actinomycetaceae TaxID=2049 RepID=A0ABZ0RAK8_9ACTO|nr:threonine ammonia-lyase IlvA [Actinotignum sanguinis]WPJ88839.1 threonine ammonia-lyase IlvA [Schaalia turicensis]MDE1553418.1 threonine ammonia-lyase IlvA [Actinotignum sanguinis]MDE1564910.1 threonine ammonia-lyase IlvA [Actinotignum sanguinis]MDE1576653.1 threonine ammonia-lyase IlvA [Actinotignum sanguinis]MDE1641450.1 threonine ammonia-lyase IlvA [Actinotignum sanguinis]